MLLGYALRLLSSHVVHKSDHFEELESASGTLRELQRFADLIDELNPPDPA